MPNSLMKRLSNNATTFKPSGLHNAIDVPKEKTHQHTKNAQNGVSHNAPRVAYSPFEYIRPANFRN